MSRGSLNYVSYQVEEAACEIKDVEIKDLVLDVANLLHDLEWYLSGDTGEGSWNEAVKNFKDKWFRKSRSNRLLEYAEKINKDNLKLIYSMFDMENYCKNCVYFEPEKDSSYGKCIHCLGYMKHRCDWSCEKFVSKDKV